MRLASKIFLASSLVILVLVGVAAWSLLAVDRLVSVSREITTRTLPALRLQAGLRDSMLTLVRLEARSLLLRDPTYGALWDERADHTRNALEHLAGYLTSDGEREHLEETQLAFAEYRAAVQSERALLGRGNQENATQLSETSARAAAERVDAGLNRLGEATQAALEHSKAEATELGARTWTTVVVALIVAVVAALAGAAFIAVRITRSVRRLLVATAAIGPGRRRAPAPGRRARDRAGPRDEPGHVRDVRRRGPARPGHDQPDLQRHPVHADRGHGDLPPHRHRPRDRDPGGGHRVWHPRRGAPVRLRPLPPGSQRARRRRPRARHRAGDGRGARRPGLGGVARGQGKPLHGRPAPSGGRAVTGGRAGRVVGGVLLVVPLVFVSGCARELVTRGDDQLVAGNYRAALAMYDQFLRSNPQAAVADRVRATRALLARYLQAEEEAARARPELTALRNEVTRLRAAPEKLKAIDVQTEQKR